MSQNSITAAALVIAFLIFITVRGELPAYFGALGLGPKAEAPAATAPAATTTVSPSVSNTNLMFNLGKLTGRTGGYNTVPIIGGGVFSMGGIF
jgi:hypothetical protein